VSAEVFEDRTLPSGTGWSLAPAFGVLDSPAAHGDQAFTPALVRQADNAAAKSEAHRPADGGGNGHGIGWYVHNLAPDVNGHRPDANGHTLPELIHTLIQEMRQSQGQHDHDGSGDGDDSPPVVTPPVVTPGPVVPPGHTGGGSTGTGTGSGSSAGGKGNGSVAEGPAARPSAVGPVANFGGQTEHPTKAGSTTDPTATNSASFFGAASKPETTIVRGTQDPGAAGATALPITIPIAAAEAGAAVRPGVVAAGAMSLGNMFLTEVLSQTAPAGLAAALDPALAGMELSALTAVLTPQGLEPQAANVLADLGAGLALDVLESSAGVARQVMDWFGSESVRAWLPWAGGALLAALAMEIARRQLRDRRRAALWHHEFVAAGWVPGLPEPPRGEGS